MGFNKNRIVTLLLVNASNRVLVICHHGRHLALAALLLNFFKWSHSGERMVETARRPRTSGYLSLSSKYFMIYKQAICKHQFSLPVATCGLSPMK